MIDYFLLPLWKSPRKPHEGPTSMKWEKEKNVRYGKMSHENKNLKNKKVEAKRFQLKHQKVVCSNCNCTANVDHYPVIIPPVQWILCLTIEHFDFYLFCLKRKTVLPGLKCGRQRPRSLAKSARLDLARTKKKRIKVVSASSVNNASLTL